MSTAVVEDVVLAAYIDFQYVAMIRWTKATWCFDRYFAFYSRLGEEMLCKLVSDGR